jgi:hypothetical protein
MSVYGDLLAAFPELIQEHQFFTMTPRTGGGYYNKTNLYKKEGAFIRARKSKSAVQGEARVINETGVFYCYENSPYELVRQGDYFEVDGEVLTIVDSQVYNKEGGFGVYTCQLVQGGTYTQTEDLKVETRTIGDYPI